MLIINIIITNSPEMNIDTLIQIYIEVDDFFLEFGAKIKEIRLNSGFKRQRQRKTKMSDAEMMTLYIAFHHSGYTKFKTFYTQHVQRYWNDLFPDLVSYERFNHLQSRLVLPLMVMLHKKCLGHSRGINFIDSTTLKVCHIKREKQHRVFHSLATKGKGTMGWFYGFKLHLVINDQGELLSYYLSKANVDDRNLQVINCLVKNMFGKLYGDRGYISKTLADYLWNDGISLIYKRRRNMKSQNLSDEDKLLLRKRALIESVNDELKNICSIEHTRHRSVQGFLNNLTSAMCAYHFLPKKPKLKFENIDQSNQLCLNMAA